MQQRPTFFDVRSPSSETLQTSASSPHAPISPRMQHFDGEIPPAMSPLDMFAAQSRLLARQLEESKQDGRRVSRLPPLSTADPIAKSMFHNLRAKAAGMSPPHDSTALSSREDDTTGTLAEVEEPQSRPKSFYPRMSHVPSEDEDDDEGLSDPLSANSDGQVFSTPMEYHSPKEKDYFAFPSRTRPQDPTLLHNYAAPPPHQLNQQRGIRFPHTQRNPELAYQPARTQEPRRELSLESNSSKSASSNLAPPKLLENSKHGGIRSVPADSSDEENSASTTGSGFSRNRKLSSSSNVSLPMSPFPPFLQSAHARSPSVNSELSIGGTHLPRPAFNFSRPLSRASQPPSDVTQQPAYDGRPSLEVPPTAASHDQRHGPADGHGFLSSDDATLPRPSCDTDRSVDLEQPAASYTYSKFALPRGRSINRESKLIQDVDLPSFNFSRSDMPEADRPTTPLANRAASPSSFVSQSSLRSPRQYQYTELQRASPKPSSEQQRGRPSLDAYPQRSPNPSIELHRPPPQPRHDNHIPQSPPSSTYNKSAGSPRPSTERNIRPPQSKLNQAESSVAPLQSSDDASEYTSSTRSGSTIKARPANPPDPLELTPDQHLGKGIELHERGASREATYHWRIAAKRGVPHAMLLYALACRHGWGMRANQTEAVQWLRRAADCASLEIADDEDSANKADILERKKQRAQFALSIYELGQSHYNGWGIEQDRILALRCFEIAAGWGDADAMQEAGFCYANGEGCKKDMKKAAKYYRMAEVRGVSMIGQSWIHKAKYTDGDDKLDKSASKPSKDNSNPRNGRGIENTMAPTTTPEKKSRDKSRTRTIFGRKKSISQVQTRP